MDQPPPTRHALWAYVGPFALFAVSLQLTALRWAGTFAPEFWVYPLQTLLCGVMLIYYRREYPRGFGPASVVWGTVVGLAAFALWISPQAFLHAAPRIKDGFDPTRLLTPGEGWGDNRFYRFTLAWRFLRLVLVVPLVEEIFWRGFLLRFLIREDFLLLPFGSWSRLSFAVVTAGFVLEHHVVDWPAALVTGVLYNLVAIRTRSLPACVLAHAVTNALLGLYVMQTRQWGFW